MFQTPPRGAVARCSESDDDLEALFSARGDHRSIVEQPKPPSLKAVKAKEKKAMKAMKAETAMKAMKAETAMKAVKVKAQTAPTAMKAMKAKVAPKRKVCSILLISTCICIYGCGVGECLRM